MAARTTWLILWPVLGAAAFLDWLLYLAACADDGAADYGDETAQRFCRDFSQWGWAIGDRRLLGLALGPIAVLAA